MMNISGIVRLCFVVVLAVSMVESSGHKLCGPQLSKALEMVCENGYNPRPARQSITPEDYYNDIDSEPSVFDQLQFLGKFRSAILGKPSRKTRKGIVEECCKRNCSIEDLLAYCVSP